MTAIEEQVMECIDEKIAPSQPEPEKMQVEIPLEPVTPEELNTALALCKNSYLFSKVKEKGAELSMPDFRAHRKSFRVFFNFMA